MAKRKKRTNVMSPPGKYSVSSNRPRLNPQERLLSRFYEPLVLLFTLGRTRGERSGAVVASGEYLAHLPLKELRRLFLTELAYMCDYDKGGETVTALGLEATPQKHIFWVASNASSKTKIVEFLRSLLTKILRVSAVPDTAKFAVEVAEYCISFATPRIRKYRSHLKPVLRRCISYLTKTHSVVEPGLVEWLQKWEHLEYPLELCQTAYFSRKCNFMRTLARLSAVPNYKSNEDAIHSVFGRVRHYIGRLGHHFRAADILVSCAPRLMDVLHEFEVCRVPGLAQSTIPPPDQLTRADKILVRMLPSNSPHVKHYQQALADMDSRHQVFDRFIQYYIDSGQSPCVHAEVKVLEHFYASRLPFAGDDPYVACSKPACFCCLLYFRHHPGNVVEPSSHNKIYLNWRPPEFSTTSGLIGPNHQRDILNAMNREIRQQAFEQLDRMTAPRAGHPDSHTRITQSIPSEQMIELAEAFSVSMDMADMDSIPEYNYETSHSSKGSEESLFQGNDGEDGDEELQSSASSICATQNYPPSSSLEVEECVSDSDEGGGVVLGAWVP